jgi:hypothetical protein
VCSRILDAISLAAGEISSSAVVRGFPVFPLNKDISYEANLASCLHSQSFFISGVDLQGPGDSRLGTVGTEDSRAKHACGYVINIGL